MCLKQSLRPHEDLNRLYIDEHMGWQASDTVPFWDPIKENIVSKGGPIEPWPQSKVSDMKTVMDKIVHDVDTAT